MTAEQFAIWVFAAYLGTALAYSTNRSWRISTWPYTLGTLSVAKVDYMHMIERGSAWENVEYEYEVNGVTYTSTRLSPLVVRGQVGPRIKKQLAKIQYTSSDQIKVFYDPKKPQKSYLVKETWLNIFG